jgi:hypothetical protein
MKSVTEIDLKSAYILRMESMCKCTSMMTMRNSEFITHLK